MDRGAGGAVAGTARTRVAAARSFRPRPVQPGAGVGASLAVRPTDAARSLRALRRLPCHRRPRQCRPLRADAGDGDAGTRLAAVGESAVRHRRKKAQGQQGNPGRRDARCGGVLPAHQRPRPGQGGADLSGRANEPDHRQRTAQDPGRAPRRCPVRAGQRSRAPVAANGPQPLHRSHDGLARAGAEPGLATGAGGVRRRSATVVTGGRQPSGRRGPVCAGGTKRQVVVATSQRGRTR